MAKATANFTKPVPVPQPTIESVTLELSVEEVRILTDLTGRIYGDPNETYRGVASSIYDALVAVVPNNFAAFFESNNLKAKPRPPVEGEKYTVEYFDNAFKTWHPSYGTLSGGVYDKAEAERRASHRSKETGMAYRAKKVI